MYILKGIYVSVRAVIKKKKNLFVSFFLNFLLYVYYYSLLGASEVNVELPLYIDCHFLTEWLAKAELSAFHLQRAYKIFYSIWPKYVFVQLRQLPCCI